MKVCCILVGSSVAFYTIIITIIMFSMEENIGFVLGLLSCVDHGEH